MIEILDGVNCPLVAVLLMLGGCMSAGKDSRIARLQDAQGRGAKSVEVVRSSSYLRAGRCARL